MIYKAVKYILENDADFAAAVGTDTEIKIYPIHPRKEVSLPFCVFNVLSLAGNFTKSAPSGLDENTVRITVYDDALDDVIDLAEKARTAMDNEQAGGTYNGVVVHTIDFIQSNDGWQPGFGDRGALLIEMDFNIWSEP